MNIKLFLFISILYTRFYKIGNPYSEITNGSKPPFSYCGASTIVYSGSSFFGLNGSSWKQLDN